MRSYLFRKWLQFMLTLAGVAVLIFLLLRVIPGDVVAVKLMSEGHRVSAEVLQMERARLGIDQPLYVQFAQWVWGMMRLDMGTSMWTGRSVVEEIGERFMVTFEVAVLAVLVGTLLAAPMGLLAAVYRGSWVDQGVRLFAVLGISLPAFWVGLLAQTGLLKAFGWLPQVAALSWKEDPLGHLAQIGLPALIVGWRLSAVVARMLRSSMLEVLQEDYVRTAKAKGVPKWTMLTRHAARNALLPAVTLLGLEFAYLLGGLVVTEQVFNLNGVGRLLVQAVSQGDYVLIQGLVMMFALSFVLINFLVDVLYAVLDPRVRRRA